MSIDQKDKIRFQATPRLYKAKGATRRDKAT